MHICAATLDDLIHEVFELLLKNPNPIDPCIGAAREEIGVLLELENPRARLSTTETRGKPFSCLGEFLWYLARSNDLEFVRYYIPMYKKFSDDKRTLHGAYGPRLFRMRGVNQIANVIEILRKPDSRRAVVQLFNAEDIVRRYKDTPCTCTLQFMNRRGQLHMMTTMRSNDAFLGMPHDIFAFTMLQEVIARTVDLEIGTYKHAVGSLHLYERNTEKAKQYLKEGWQPTTAPMPEMPTGDPWSSIEQLLKAEREIRAGEEIDFRSLNLDPYWEDLVRLLIYFGASNSQDTNEMARIRDDMASEVYKIYMDQA